jgi:hypothetical protein
MMTIIPSLFILFRLPILSDGTRHMHLRNATLNPKNTNSLRAISPLPKNASANAEEFPQI